MRKEAVENRQRLLDAADDLFAQKGTAASVAEIVRAAGVGPPTLYRHFGTKEGLIKAIGERRQEVVAAQLARALAQPTGIGGLRLAIEQHLDMARDNRAVRELRGVPIPESLERMLLAGWETLIDRCHAEGSVRHDFAPTDVPFFLAGVAAVGRTVRYEPQLQERYVELLMQSLRPDAPRPLPGRPPSADDVRRAFAPTDPSAAAHA